MNKRFHQPLKVANLFVNETAASIASTATGKFMASWTPAVDAGVYKLRLATVVTQAEALPSISGMMVVYNQASPFYSTANLSNCLMSHWCHTNVTNVNPTALSDEACFASVDGFKVQAGQPISLYALMKTNAAGQMTSHLAIYYYDLTLQ